MAFFPRYTNTFGADFAPLFRLLDESLTDVNRAANGRHASVRAFSPRFDVRELNDSYQLDGEFPGVDQKNINIEFTDPHTLVIKGKTEYVHESGDAALLESGEIQGRIADTEAKDKTHQASVEDEDAPSSSQAVAPTEQSSEKAVQQQAAPLKSRSWISERSVGEFHRSFSFPSRVDQDNVKASLKNGILSVVIPKAKAPESKRISIE